MDYVKTVVTPINILNSEEYSSPNEHGFILSGKKGAMCEDFVSYYSFESNHHSVNIQLVMDGHGGKATAQSVATFLPSQIEIEMRSSLESYETGPPHFVKDCISRAFLSTSEKINSQVLEVKLSGCTCVLFLRLNDTWGIIAWVGDSQGFVFEGSDLKFKTTPHVLKTTLQNGQPWNKMVNEHHSAKISKDHEESNRCTKLGGRVFLPPSTYIPWASWVKSLDTHINHYQISPYLWFCECGDCKTNNEMCNSSFSVMTTRGFGDYPPEGKLRDRYKQIYSNEPSFSEIFPLNDSSLVLLVSDGFTDVVDDSIPDYMCVVQGENLSMKRLLPVLLDPTKSPSEKGKEILKDVRDRYQRLWHISSRRIDQMDDVSLTIYQKNGGMEVKLP